MLWRVFLTKECKNTRLLIRPLQKLLLSLSLIGLFWFFKSTVASITCITNSLILILRISVLLNATSSLGINNRICLIYQEITREQGVPGHETACWSINFESRKQKTTVIWKRLFSQESREVQLTHDSVACRNSLSTNNLVTVSCMTSHSVVEKFLPHASVGTRNVDLQNLC